MHLLAVRRDVVFKKPQEVPSRGVLVNRLHDVMDASSPTADTDDDQIVHETFPLLLWKLRADYGYNQPQSRLRTCLTPLLFAA